MKYPAFRGIETQRSTSALETRAPSRQQHLIEQPPDDEQLPADDEVDSTHGKVSEPQEQSSFDYTASLQYAQANLPSDVVSDAGFDTDSTERDRGAIAIEQTDVNAQALLGTAPATSTIANWLRGGVTAVTAGLGVANQSKKSDTSPPDFSEGDSKSISVAENLAPSKAVFIAKATDNVAVTGYALAGGADDDQFTLDTVTGELRFKSSPDFEAKASAAGSNTYQVKIKATDAAGNSAVQDLTVNVTDVDDTAPTLSIGPSDLTKTPTVVKGPLSLSLQLSEAVPGFDASHLQVDGASVLSFSADSPTHFTLVLQPPANTQGKLTVDVLTAELHDVAGNPLASVPTYSYNYNTINTVIQGTVQAGPLLPGHQLSMTFYDAQSRVLVSRVQIDSQGHFQVVLGDYSGVVWCIVQNGSGESDYLDEATRGPKDLSSPLLAADVVTVAGATMVININPLTTLAALKAGAQVSESGTGQLTLNRLLKY